MVDNLMNDLALTPEQLKERQIKEQRELEIKREREEQEKSIKPQRGGDTGWGGK